MNNLADNAWQRLSVRTGANSDDGPYEGMPTHLMHPAGEWLRDRFGWRNTGGMNHNLMANVASSIRLPIRTTHKTGGISDQIFGAIEADEGLYLDCLDATLYHSGYRGEGSGLARTLHTGGSVWTVNSAGTGLERRVSVSAKAAFDSVTSVSDSATAELKEAWSAAFGRSPDASDSWDHAIKAVEDVLIPIVVPKVAKANLGSVAGELKANPDKWKLGLSAPTPRNNGETLEGLIRHIWPNPDRHGGSAKRKPSQDEAEAVVHIAVLIVAICRDRLSKV